ncbi:unnamed protein product [Alopecurus aequalis]
MADMKTLLFVEVPVWIRNLPPLAVHDAVKDILNPLAATHLISCPDFQNLRVEFFSHKDAKFVKDCFDVVGMETKMVFSDFELSSLDLPPPEVSFLPAERDIYQPTLYEHLEVYYPEDPSWFNRTFPMQKGIRRGYYISGPPPRWSP